MKIISFCNLDLIGFSEKVRVEQFLKEINSMNINNFYEIVGRVNLKICNEIFNGCYSDIYLESGSFSFSFFLSKERLVNFGFDLNNLYEHDNNLYEFLTLRIVF